MPLFRRRGFVVNQPGIQVDGVSSCPICGHTNLYKPTSALKVDSFGKPFTYITNTADNEWVEDGTFPTYGSWRCLDNNHSFRTPSFEPDPTRFAGFLPAQSGMNQAEF